MTYYLLPRTNPELYKDLCICVSDEKPKSVISNSLCFYLYKIKEKISAKERLWNSYKKITNPYEYIHTNINNKRKSVATMKPLSRSFFKMVEMMHLFSIYFSNRPIRTFHLAEGPGGFIEAVAYMRKLHSCHTEDIYVGMTLLEDKEDKNIPGWKKSAAFLKAHPNVLLENGADQTGDILSLANFVDCRARYGSSMDFITGDGGFDFSTDFNMQEIHITRLLFGQIAFAVCLQRRGGSFVLKIFDCFMKHTVDLLYLLSSFYQKTHIVKPNTSRYANSEKYIVCTGFIHDNCDAFYPYFLTQFERLSSMGAEPYIASFLRCPVPCIFVRNIEEYNVAIGKKQIQNIHYTISLMETKCKQEKIDALINANVEKCVQWCLQYGIPIQGQGTYSSPEPQPPSLGKTF